MNKQDFLEVMRFYLSFTTVDIYATARQGNHTYAKYFLCGFDNDDSAYLWLKRIERKYQVNIEETTYEICIKE